MRLLWSRHASGMLVGVRIIAGSLGSRRLELRRACYPAHQRPSARDLFQCADARIEGAVFLICMRARARWGWRRSVAGGSGGVCGAGTDGAEGFTRQFGEAGDYGEIPHSWLRCGSFSAPGRRGRSKREQYEVVFLDPPWDAAEEYAATLGLLGGAATGLLGEGRW